MWKEVNGERTYLQDAYPYNNYDISIVNDVGKVCLYLISAEKTNNVLNRKDTVFSNKVCISKAPLLYAPNAFTPRNQDLKNNTWRILVNGESAIQKFSLGHVDAFNDPLIDNKDSKKRYRSPYETTLVEGT
ncbi:hypothetical protein N9Y26_01415 [bacterium]|nr:hypothetical protein [bacterium]